MKIKKYIQKINDNSYYCKLAVSPTSSPLFEKGEIATYEKAMLTLKKELNKIKLNKEKLYKLNFFQLSQQIIKKNNQEALNVFIEKVSILKKNIYVEMIEYQGLKKKLVDQQLNTVFPKEIEELLADAQDRLLDEVEVMFSDMIQKRIKNTKELEQVRNYKESEESQGILKLINSIPGNKIITLFDGQSIEIYDVNEKGYVGYDQLHVTMLYKKLDSVRNNTGTLILRQFIPDTQEDYITPEGNTIQIPWKAVYGAILKKDSLIAIDAEELEKSFNFDIDGNPIVPEEFVIYRDFDDLFLSVK